MSRTTDPALRKAAQHAQRDIRRSERRRRRKARGSLLWRWRRPLYVLVVLAIAAIAGVLGIIARVQLPASDPLEQTTYVCASDVDPATSQCGRSNALAAFQAGVDRQVLSAEQVPLVVQEAVISAEDRDFFRHGGIDPFGIARALFQDLRNRGSLQGGSTITQQFVKNTFLTQERTLSRKLREAVLAIKVEQKYSKDEILTQYLNTIYFGRGAYGIQAASNTYFGHGIEFVTKEFDDPATRPKGLAKAAYLAGLIRSPETADSTLDPDEAAFRRDSVLAGMVEEGYVTAEEAQAAKDVPFPNYIYGRVARDSGFGAVRNSIQVGVDGNGSPVYRPIASEYVVDYVRAWLLSNPDLGLDADDVFTGGLRIYTTLDYRLQLAAYDAIYSADLGILPDLSDPAGSLVAIDERGRVRAMVGGRDFATSQVNLATGTDGGGSGRQPGSTFKAFALAEAIESGLSPLSTFPAPDKVVFPGANDGEDWEVSGGASDSGSYNLLDAMARSSNTVFAQLMLQLGAQEVVDLATTMGVTATLPAVPALVLGSGEVSVLDMASSYSTFANRGAHPTPIVVTRVEDKDGNALYEAQSTLTRVISVDTADAVTTALRGVITDGTGTRARIDRDAAGKTGTTEDYRDAWFVGYSCTGPDSNLTAAVWVGYPGTDGQPAGSMQNVRGVANVGGGTFPAEIWASFMNRAIESTPECELPRTTRFPGERRDVKEIVGGSAPAGAFRTTTTTTTTTSTTTPASSTTSTTAATGGGTSTTRTTGSTGGGTSTTVATTTTTTRPTETTVPTTAAPSTTTSGP